MFPLLLFQQIGGMRKLEKDDGMKQFKRSKFIAGFMGEDGIDDDTFNMWKSELQKELPSFWDSMSRR